MYMNAMSLISMILSDGLMGWIYATQFRHQNLILNNFVVKAKKYISDPIGRLWAMGQGIEQVSEQNIKNTGDHEICTQNKVEEGYRIRLETKNTNLKTLVK